MAILRSQWGELSPHLIASVYPIDRKTGIILPGANEVHAPFTETQGEIRPIWSSPFEQAGVASRLPAFTATLQSGVAGGAAGAIAEQLRGRFGDGIGGYLNDLAAGGAEAVAKAADELVGRTDITKINSTQIFAGIAPHSISCTLHFRAFVDAKTEVEAPFVQLLKWAHPEELAKFGALVNVVGSVGTDRGLLDSLFPSKSPRIVALGLGSRKFWPMVIEHMAVPYSTSIVKSGEYAAIAVQVTFATLTSLDERDIESFVRRN